MRIYIDFDDVICETARHFSKMVKDLFGKEVPYQDMEYFNLQKSFKLDDEQYEKLMEEGHHAKHLLAYDETPGASKTINKWIDDGHDVMVVTGRPFNSYEASRKWLDEHDLGRARLICVDKYGREKENSNHTFNITLNELYDMSFDFAVEDSPSAFKHILHFDKCKVAVFDRPWNKTAEFPNNMFIRCIDWKAVDAQLSE